MRIIRPERSEDRQDDAGQCASSDPERREDRSDDAGQCASSDPERREDRSDDAAVSNRWSADLISVRSDSAPARLFDRSAPERQSPVKRPARRRAAFALPNVRVRHHRRPSGLEARPAVALRALQGCPTHGTERAISSRRSTLNELIWVMPAERASTSATSAARLAHRAGRPAREA